MSVRDENKLIYEYFNRGVNKGIRIPHLNNSDIHEICHWTCHWFQIYVLFYALNNWRLNPVHSELRLYMPEKEVPRSFCPLYELIVPIPSCAGWPLPGISLLFAFIYCSSLLWVETNAALLGSIRPSAHRREWEVDYCPPPTRGEEKHENTFINHSVRRATYN